MRQGLGNRHPLRIELTKWYSARQACNQQQTYKVDFLKLSSCGTASKQKNLLSEMNPPNRLFPFFFCLVQGHTCPIPICY